MTSTPLESAQRIVCEEQRRLRTEKEAFEEFITKLETLTSSTKASVSTSVQIQRNRSTLSTTAQLAPESNTDAVEEYYQSTVMAVPRYTKDYGDTYWESICDEFGPAIATALKSESTLTPLLGSNCGKPLCIRSKNVLTFSPF